jgi:hypothetical protein
MLARTQLGDSHDRLSREVLRLDAMVDKKKESIDHVRERWNSALEQLRNAEEVLGQVPTDGGATPIAPAAPGLPREEKDLDPAERWSRMSAMLGSIGGGSEALELITRYSVGVAFVPNGGGFYNVEENRIVLDASWTLRDNALAIVHEANHVRYAKEGLDADITKLSRADYVSKKLEEESEGTVKEIEAKAEFVAARVKMPQGDPLEVKYKRAASAAMRAAKRKDKTISDDDLKKAGVDAGRAAVFKEFKRGAVFTSNTRQPYPVYYGQAWDKAHGT